MSLQDEFSALGQSKINIRNAIQSKGVTLASPNDMTTYAEAISGIVVGTRNIGEIIQSTIPLVDDGLHLLDGALIDGNGIYRAFVDYIASIYDASANYFTTEASWQDSVTNYGVCGKFVYDSVNNTVRLPKITGFIEGASGVTNLGDLTLAGLPDHTHSYTTVSGTYVAMGGDLRFYNSTSVSGTGLASATNPIYGRSNTVQPQSIKVLYYVVIATSTKTDIQVDIDEIATDLNGKADVDLSNTNNQAKILMSGMGMPSDRYIDLTLGANGTTYTAPANGYFCFNGRDTSNTGTAEVVIRNQTRYFGVAGANTDSARSPAWSGYILPVKKGDIVGLYYIGTLAFNNTNWSWRFYYAKGSESEAQ